jgi:hypothetical protein
MKVLVCGGRDFTDRELLYEVLDEYIYGPEDEIISGMARGADMMAAEYGWGAGIRVWEFPAQWDVHGRAAGPIRNQQMLDEGKPDLVLAFPGGKGTAHMVRISKRAGVEVREIE